eukprot:1478360-Prymnesium_polylepis.1
MRPTGSARFRAGCPHAPLDAKRMSTSTGWQVPPWERTATPEHAADAISPERRPRARVRPSRAPSVAQHARGTRAHRERASAPRHRTLNPRLPPGVSAALPVLRSPATRTRAQIKNRAPSDPPEWRGRHTCRPLAPRHREPKEEFGSADDGSFGQCRHRRRPKHLAFASKKVMCTTNYSRNERPDPRAPFGFAGFGVSFVKRGGRKIRCTAQRR